MPWEERDDFTKRLKIGHKMNEEEFAQTRGRMTLYCLCPRWPPSLPTLSVQARESHTERWSLFLHPFESELACDFFDH